MNSPQGMKQRLLEQKADLDRRLAAIDSDLGTALDADSSERAVQTENDEVLVAMKEAALSELKALDAAVARLDAGTYGTCAICGEAIDEDRLAAIPQAALCFRCASQAT